MRRPLWREDVCHLLIQLLLGLARAVTLGSKFSRTHDNILLSHLRPHQPGGPGPRIYIPQDQGGPVTPLGTGFPFRRLLRLEVFWPASTRVSFVRLYALVKHVCVCKCSRTSGSIPQSWSTQEFESCFVANNNKWNSLRCHTLTWIALP
jgi:hypothetical protein